MTIAIIDKIRQLRELSKSSNINEAANAAAAADRLIAKFRISEAELAYSHNNESSPEEDSFVLYETSRLINWKLYLAQVLSKHYGCAIYNSCIIGSKPYERKISRFKLVGLQSDMEITRYMFAWLVSEIERLCKLNCYGRGHVYCASYCDGAVKGIFEQLQSAKNDEFNKASQSCALAVLDSRLTKSEAALNSLYNNLRIVKSQSHRKNNVYAFNEGVKAGKNIHLGKVMNESDSDKLLK